MTMRPIVICEDSKTLCGTCWHESTIRSSYIRCDIRRKNSENTGLWIT